ncbi:hypothetical protein EMPS_11626 [Entomortierella parvispora]|uniref:Uncharacterized protein n=1 Tax=Entomortierella parvispora TaxID=205924 RepID=A0A9P3HMR7_9FUNG|nr:hypothetical protein EMPS_11626 [Entomortierella parvispora]
MCDAYKKRGHYSRHARVSHHNHQLDFPAPPAERAQGQRRRNLVWSERPRLCHLVSSLLALQSLPAALVESVYDEVDYLRINL